MDNVESTIASYVLYLEDFMYDMRSYKHTHPPITTRDDNCLYCKKYGNVFANGVNTNNGDLNTYIVPLQKN